MTACENRHKCGNKFHQLCGLVLWYSLNELEKAEPKHQLSKANHFYYLCPRSCARSLSLLLSAHFFFFCIHYLSSLHQTLVLSVPTPYSVWLQNPSLSVQPDAPHLALASPHFVAMHVRIFCPFYLFIITMYIIIIIQNDVTVLGYANMPISAWKVPSNVAPSSS